MAGDWIKMRRSLLTDPRVVRISSALNADRFRTIGGLFSAWCLFDEHTSDGHLHGYTAKIFDEIVGINGLASAMESVGWVEITDEFIKATAFTEHNGQSAKRRAQESVRKMSARNADTTRTKMRTREEKRREEIHTHTHNASENKSIVPEELQECWERWCLYRESQDGRPPDPIRSDAMLMDLSRRGSDKAAKDIEFSILKGARSILDSDNDFQTSRSKSSKPKNERVVF